MNSAFEGLPKTPNLKLNKPGYDNVADIEALNENADILDEEIQGIKNTFVKSVNGINAGDDGNVDLGIIPIAKGGTGQTTASGVRNALGLGNTTGAVPIANGGTGATTVASARNALGLGNTSGAVPITNGGTGATTAKQACANIGAVRSVNGVNADDSGNVQINTMPVGMVIPFASDNIPNGYLPCNGSAISRTTYADLFAVIGTTYGAGDGSTTFNLPNLNNNSFLEGSDTVGTVKSAGLPNIKSTLKDVWFGAAKSVDGAFNFTNNPGPTKIGSGSHTFYCANIDFDAGNSNSIYSDNVNTVQPKSVTVKFCIKY